MAQSSLKPPRRWEMLLNTPKPDSTWVGTQVNVAESGSTGKTAVAP